MFVEDLTPLFADFGIPAIAGADSATVLLDMPQQDVFGGAQQSTEYAITYRLGDLPGLKSGDGITVAALAYVVRQVTLQDDGKLIHATLQR